VTVTITPAPPSASCGLGIGVTVASDFIGPLPSGSFWGISYTTDSATLDTIWSETFLTNTQAARLLIPGLESHGAYVQPSQWPVDGATVYITALLGHPATIDTGQITATWRTTAGLAYLEYVHFNTIFFNLASPLSVNAILAAVRGHYQNAP
jgi:hypothetical protein